MKRFMYPCLLLLCIFAAPGKGEAESQSLSVTPPLFQLSINPGDVWQSSIRVINSNDFPLTVHAEVVNFTADGENGQGRFMPVLEEDTSLSTMADWIDIPFGPHTIPAGESKDVSFFIDVPQDAAPGGHFASILISTEPPLTEGAPLALVTAQTVASLFFTRIEGDILEIGDIREFTVVDRPVSLPTAEFSLRFENKGNVHVQPQGDIVILNMWGTERGRIPVNHKTHFGNVLPQSIRDFRFTWKGERSLADIGRYEAIATLAYGDNGIKSVSRTTYFWVIPIKGVLLTFGSIAFFIWAVSWMIRGYIRRMLMLAGVRPEEEERGAIVIPSALREVTIASPDIKLTSYRTVSAPLRSGAAELRSKLRQGSELFEVISIIVSFVFKYYRFFLALLILIIGFVALVSYVREVGDASKEFEVTIDEGGSSRTLTDEEVRAGLAE